MINSPEIQCVNAIHFLSHCFDQPGADDKSCRGGPATLSSDQPAAWQRARADCECHTVRQTVCPLNIHVKKPSPNTSVFQKVNHLFLKDKITLQSWVNMNDHKKTWFLTERKPISRIRGLNFFLSLFKGRLCQNNYKNVSILNT